MTSFISTDFVSQVLSTFDVSQNVLKSYLRTLLTVILMKISILGHYD